MKTIGIIPAAGKAKRLGNIDSSKEILKVNYQGQKKVISSFLIDNYKDAGINQIYFIIREGKWDIPAYYANGANYNVHFSYLFAQYPYGVPFTLFEATHFLDNQNVALGFPDMFLSPKNAFKLLQKRIEETKTDLVLGLFPIETKSKWDMVEMDESGKITDIIIKPKNSPLKYGWSIAIWSPVFTKFLQNKIYSFLNNEGKARIELEENLGREIYPGDLFKEFILEGNKTEYVLFEDGKCIDLGTWEDFNNFNDGKER